jgi:hypothetical protein
MLGVLALALLFVGTPSSAAGVTPVLGDHPFLVVLCNFSNEQVQPKPVSYYEDMFSDAGAGHLGALDMWSDFSFGQASISGTVVKGWYTLPMTRDQWIAVKRNVATGDMGQEWSDCVQAAAPDVNFNDYQGAIAIFPEAEAPLAAPVDDQTTQIQVKTTGADFANYPTPPFQISLDDGTKDNGETLEVTAIQEGLFGVATFTVERGQAGTTAHSHNILDTQGNPVLAQVPGDFFGFGRGPVTLAGTRYTLGGVLGADDIGLSLFGHEMGHAFGLNHSRAWSKVAASGDYNDCYDLMSNATCSIGNGFSGIGDTFGGNPYGGTQKGPGLDALQLDTLGWIPPSRQYFFDNQPCQQTSVLMHSLNDYGGALTREGELETQIPEFFVIPTYPAGHSTVIDEYSVSYREKAGWDSGFPGDIVLIDMHGQDGYDYWADTGPGSYSGQNGYLTPGQGYVDSGGNAYVFFISKDTSAHTAELALGSCPMTASLTFTADPVTGNPQATSGDWNDKLVLSAKLTVGGLPVPNQTIPLAFRTTSCDTLGSTCTIKSCEGTTDANGVASCNLILNDPGEPPGTYEIGSDWPLASFDGFTTTSVSEPFTMTAEEENLTYTGPNSGDYNDQIPVSAHLVDPADLDPFTGQPEPIVGQEVSFDLGKGDGCNGFTDNAGNATCTITPAQEPGNKLLSVAFGGDGYYNAQGFDIPFTLNKEDTAVFLRLVTTGHYHDATSVTAQLQDGDDGSPIAGKSIKFTLPDGDTCSNKTDATGTATCPLTPSQGGTQNLTAAFGGDTDYLASSRTHLFAATPEETTLTYTGPTLILAETSNATLTATMVEDGSNDSDGDGGSPAPVPAQTVTLSVGTQSCTGMTDASGNVTCKIPSVTVPLGPEIVGASFAANADYQAASSTKQAIVFAFPSTGVFTLADNTVSAAMANTTVTWWSNNWYLLDNLSGGTAPPAFKGFVQNVTLPNTTPPTICGGNWTTPGGNSSTPPGTVPSYMGVVVTNKVNKAPGNTVSGSYAKIVVVKTDPGYAPGPQNAGAGTIVATFCG